ncbi:ankyrin repeat domain-containing protein 17 isoform X5 [Halyomorpha halys]|uniref:ankyrin repeat domain-containing protein 17 isoform X5 n=1 Tax=Halyomorpha halys TaxID=286706 RepID=UPI0006D4DD56|nr:ankyrin repeat domain-containing protein 17 isoform X5 [Halyomorpha halys]
MQNVGQDNTPDNKKLDKVNAHEIGKSSTPQSSNSSPTKSDTDPFSEINPRFLSDSSESEEEESSEVESFVIGDLEEPEGRLQSSKFLLSQEDVDPTVDPETQARLEALLEAAGNNGINNRNQSKPKLPNSFLRHIKGLSNCIGKLATGDGKQLADPEVLRRLTSSVSCALDEAAAALTRMRSENNPRPQPERSLVEACTDGDVGTVKKLLTEGRSVHETTEEGESLLSLACSAGYYELAQVLLAMHANVEDRGIKGDCTPLMEAASSGYVDIVRLLIHHGADVNAQSSSGNTPLMYACAGGHVDAVRVLLEAGANVEDHNENGHTPLMEAASAGHVPVAQILLEHGAGINTHSNEFKESALTLACYKGHLDMVRFLLEAGADQEHKTDEMHTALMEASMDGHVEVARLLLDSGAQVNMPTDSFESPLTLAACGGHVDLALLLIERGANIEEVNDEGYTPLMEAAREGHEDMVAVLLVKGANINAQTEETQETALTLACCGGFLEVANFLIRNGAEIELGASTPLMEAAQEGHLELVRYLLEANANVNAQTQTGDTALTYSCENGHTDVARLLLQYGADLEHESEGGRTPLMKACRAGHLCTVKFLIQHKANVNKQTTNNDHTPLSLAAAGGHIAVVELLLANNANPFHKLKDNSTMLIEAAKGGHTNVVQLLLDYPHSIMMSNAQQGQQVANAAGPAGFHDVPDTVRALPPPIAADQQPDTTNTAKQPPTITTTSRVEIINGKHIPIPGQKSLLRKNRAVNTMEVSPLTSPEVQQVRNEPGDGGVKEEPIKKEKTQLPKAPLSLETSQFIQRQQIVEELQRVEEELKEKGTVLDGGPISPTSAITSLLSPTTPPGPPPPSIPQHGIVCPGGTMFGVSQSQPTGLLVPQQPPQVTIHQPITTPADVVQATAISDRPKAKPTWKKEGGKGVRKQVVSFQPSLPQQGQYFDHSTIQQLKQLAYKSEPETILGYPPLTGEAWAKAAPGAPPSHLHDQSALHLHGDPQRLSSELNGLEIPRRCPILTDEEPMFDLSRSKIDQEPLDPLALDDVPGNLGNSDRDRIRYNNPSFIAGVEAASKLMGAPGSGTPFQVVPTEHGTLQMMPTEQGTLQYLCAAAAATAPPPAPPTQHLQSMNYNSAQCPGAVEQPPEKPRPGQYHQPQLLLKAPPPWVKPPESGGQVATGTQTSPGPDAPKKAPAPPPSTKGKKARYQLQQKATQAPPLAPDSSQMGYPGCGGETTPGLAPPFCMDVDSATDSNNDTALTLACAGGHEELVQLLLSRGANIEHRDKKGFTPLILAATAGHEKVVEILMNHSADMEAQSERTKDTPLSLACSGGRYEVVELLLSKGANKEHRNVSDYTPLSLAASGGYVNIIKLLLTHGAEINSRTGSKLGISPLMLAAMNGHTAAVKLLLDMGSDINAQIETNRNTALTLACFQGRHEVVSLLLDRRANVEHRAKTGLTPLMEAASGGYVEVGRVLLDKGADVNAPPVPSSRDTALTIAADKGHCRFVELLLNRSAQVEVKNKKGNSPLWLAANGGHLAVVELLYNAGADIDSQDNRKVSCLMAAFRKGHVKVVKWMVNHVMQFPSDQEMTRYISTVNDKVSELLEKCQECTKIIRAAKDQQAAKANKNATILLEELYMEKTREESKRAAAARRRERKKKKKLEKKEEKRKLQEENQKNERYANTPAVEEDEEPENEDEDKPGIKAKVNEVIESPARAGEGEEGDSGIDANSQGSCSSNEVKAGAGRRKEKKKKKPPPGQQQVISTPNTTSLPSTSTKTSENERRNVNNINSNKSSVTPSNAMSKSQEPALTKTDKREEKGGGRGKKGSGGLVFEPTRHPAEREDFEATGSDSYLPATKGKKISYISYCDDMITPSKGSTGGVSGSSSSPKQGGKRDEGWKEVVRKYLNSPFRSKKVSVPLNAISRVIGRGGSNINAIRTATGAHIEVEKQSKGQGERIITLKGSSEATKQAHSLIAALIKDPDVDILQILPKSAKSAAAVWEKSVNTAKSKPSNKTSQPSAIVSLSNKTTTSGVLTSVAPLIPPRSSASSSSSRVTAPRLASHVGKRQVSVSSSTCTKTTMSYTGAIMTSGRGGSGTSVSLNSSSSSGKQPASAVTQTFAAKLTEPSPPQPQPQQAVTQPSTAPPATSIATEAVARPPSPPAALPPTPSPPAALPPPPPAPQISLAPPSSASVVPSISSAPSTTATLEYSLFNDTFTKVAQQSMWGRENDCQKGINFASVAATGAPNSSVSQLPPPSNKYLDPSPPQVGFYQVDASKAPGYRGNVVCSPVSKPVSVAATAPTPSYFPPPTDLRPPPLYQGAGNQELEFHPAASRLNPRAPDFSTQAIKPVYPYLGQVLPPGTGNISFASGKFPPRAGQAGGVARWPFAGPPPPAPQPPQQPQYQPDLDAASSPSSPQHDDRKIPRPIGTERASWKNFTSSQEVEMTPSWMIDAAAGKIPGWNGIVAPAPGQGGGLERAAHHMFRPNPPAGVPFSRIPIPDDISHIIDTPPYQTGLDGSQYNGALLHSLPVLAHYGSTVPDIHEPQWEPTRLPPIQIQDLHPDKTHGWAAKWNH